MSIISTRAKMLGMNYGEYDIARARGELPKEELDFWEHRDTGWMPKDFIKLVDLLNTRKKLNKSGEIKVTWTDDLRKELAALINMGYSQTDVAQTIKMHTEIPTMSIANQMPNLRAAGLIQFTPRKKKTPEAMTDEEPASPTEKPVPVVKPIDFDKILEESFSELNSSSEPEEILEVDEDMNGCEDEAISESAELTAPHVVATAVSDESDNSSTILPADITETLPVEKSEAQSSTEVDADFDVSSLSTDPMYLLEVLKKMVKHSVNADKIVSLSASCETSCAEVRYRIGGQTWSVKIACDLTGSVFTEPIDNKTDFLNSLKEYGVDIGEFERLFAERIERTKKSFLRDYFAQVGVPSEKTVEVIEFLVPTRFQSSVKQR